MLLNVEDVARSMEFYGHLGFSEHSRWETEEHGLGWCQLVVGDHALMLNQKGVLAQERRAYEDYTDLVIYLYVDDAAEAFAELRAVGIEGRHVGPQDYGLDEVWLRDPDGYHVVVASDAPGP